MRHLFLDTNVLIDFLVDRKPFSEEAAGLFEFASGNHVRLYVSAVSFNNIYYILRRSMAHKDAITVLKELQQWTEVIDVTGDVINESIHSDFKDFEDAIQHHCARSVNSIDFIVTRDAKGFKASVLPVLSPREAFALLLS